MKIFETSHYPPIYDVQGMVTNPSYPTPMSPHFKSDIIPKGPTRTFQLKNHLNHGWPPVTISTSSIKPPRENFHGSRGEPPSRKEFSTPGYRVSKVTDNSCSNDVNRPNSWYNELQVIRDRLQLLESRSEGRTLLHTKIINYAPQQSCQNRKYRSDWQHPPAPPTSAINVDLLNVRKLTIQNSNFSTSRQQAMEILRRSFLAEEQFNNNGSYDIRQPSHLCGKTMGGGPYTTTPPTNSNESVSLRHREINNSNHLKHLRGGAPVERKKSFKRDDICIGKRRESYLIATTGVKVPNQPGTLVTNPNRPLSIPEHLIGFPSHRDNYIRNADIYCKTAAPNHQVNGYTVDVPQSAGRFDDKITYQNRDRPRYRLKSNSELKLYQPPQYTPDCKAAYPTKVLKYPYNSRHSEPLKIYHRYQVSQPIVMDSKEVPLNISPHSFNQLTTGPENLFWPSVQPAVGQLLPSRVKLSGQKSQSLLGIDKSPNNLALDEVAPIIETSSPNNYTSLVDRYGVLEQTRVSLDERNTLKYSVTKSSENLASPNARIFKSPPLKDANNSSSSVACLVPPKSLAGTVLASAKGNKMVKALRQKFSDLMLLATTNPNYDVSSPNLTQPCKKYSNGKDGLDNTSCYDFKLKGQSHDSVSSIAKIQKTVDEDNASWEVTRTSKCSPPKKGPNKSTNVYNFSKTENLDLQQPHQTTRLLRGPNIKFRRSLTFDASLEEAFPSEYNPLIPALVYNCVQIIECYGLKNIGIYRIPGNNNAITDLTKWLDVNYECSFNSLWSDKNVWRDVNVVASILKSFFRRLRNPLLTNELYHPIIESNRLNLLDERLITLKKFIHILPVHHYHTLKFIVAHLNKVRNNCEHNRMNSQNLAIIFGPTIVRISTEISYEQTATSNTIKQPKNISTKQNSKPHSRGSSSNCSENLSLLQEIGAMVRDMPDQCKIVEALIDNYSWFFENTIPPENENVAVAEPSQATKITVNEEAVDITNQEGIIDDAKTIFTSTLNYCDENLNNVNKPNGSNNDYNHLEHFSHNPKSINANYSRVIGSRVGLNSTFLPNISFTKPYQADSLSLLPTNHLNNFNHSNNLNHLNNLNMPIPPNSWNHSSFELPHFYSYEYDSGIGTLPPPPPPPLPNPVLHGSNYEGGHSIQSPTHLSPKPCNNNKNYINHVQPDVDLRRPFMIMKTNSRNPKVPKVEDVMLQGEFRESSHSSSSREADVSEDSGNHSRGEFCRKSCVTFHSVGSVGKEIQNGALSAVICDAKNTKIKWPFTNSAIYLRGMDADPGTISGNPPHYHQQQQQLSTEEDEIFHDRSAVSKNLRAEPLDQNVILHEPPRQRKCKNKKLIRRRHTVIGATDRTDIATYKRAKTSQLTSKSFYEPATRTHHQPNHQMYYRTNESLNEFAGNTNLYVESAV